MDNFEQLDDIERDLVHKAAAGEDIRDARKQQAFQLLLGAAKERAIAARNKLVTVDPHDWKKVQHLQNEVSRYEEMADWLRTAVLQGEQAFAQLAAMRGDGRSDDEAAQPD